MKTAWFLILLWITVIVGWCMNIYQLTQMGGEVTSKFILKVVGIFVVPLGSILGLFN